MPRELTPRSLRLTHDDPKAQGEEGQPTVLQQVLEFRARFPVSGLSPGSAFTVSCVTGCSGGRWAQDEDPLLVSFLYPLRASPALHRHVGGLQADL